VLDGSTDWRKPRGPGEEGGRGSARSNRREEATLRRRLCPSAGLGPWAFQFGAIHSGRRDWHAGVVGAALAQSEQGLLGEFERRTRHTVGEFIFGDGPGFWGWMGLLSSETRGVGHLQTFKRMPSDCRSVHNSA